jgi:cell division septum initiation protein DivIVA
VAIPGSETGPDAYVPTENREGVRARLPRRTRGYDCDATDQLLRELATRQAELDRECGQLREHAARLEADLAQHRRQEELLSKTMISATRFAMTIREEARKEAEQVLQKARAEGVDRTAAAGRVEHDLKEAERELHRLQQITQEMRTGLSTFLTDTLTQLTPEAREAVESSPTDSVEGALASALGDALQKGDDDVLRESGELAPPGVSP